LKEFVAVNPLDESRFPGVRDIARRLQSFDWVYAKTPSFSISRTFVKQFSSSDRKYELETNMSIEKGCVSKLEVNLLAHTEGENSNNDPVSVPFRLLELLPVVGAKVEAENLQALWERGREIVMKEEGKEDYELLVWGVECLELCVPVGFGQEWSQEVKKLKNFELID
jgi:hypothetical protein